MPFRLQNGGHYDDKQVLKSGLGAGESGTRIHLVQARDRRSNCRSWASLNVLEHLELCSAIRSRHFALVAMNSTEVSA